jgi:predicted nuclease of predicted toxin-antitoxin system
VTRLLLDQRLPRSAAAILRAAGWDVLHVGECGLATGTDSHMLDVARSDGRHIVTLDADSHSLLAVAGEAAPSVGLRMEGLKGDDLAALIQRLWPRLSVAMSGGAMVTVTRGAVRIKRLPVER